MDRYVNVELPCDFGVTRRTTAVAEQCDRDATLTGRKDPLEPPSEDVDFVRGPDHQLSTIHPRRQLMRLAHAYHHAIQSGDLPREPVDWSRIPEAGGY